ncbi:hypothetical protein KI387_034302 [Taxus chinensis]|uniref:Uncharacterized protein n=1 Tax=Taxus chinensis TaxID=29808 RepID=A0AA38F5Z5_TAXCH|nr:hypothetical protein KI387_034302 [Taxus chinensis]
METPTASLVTDLQVKGERVITIRPEKSTERHSLFLSNIDQKLVGYVLKFVHFFSGNQEIAFDAIIYIHTEALRRILVPYDFMCGRLTFNSKQRRFEIDCNAAGVPFAICSSELSLAELGDISYPNPAFSQLCFLPGSTNRNLEDEPLISFQVTRFTCGGFAVGTAENHSLMDGFALQEFAKNFTHLARMGDMAFQPVTDRTCLKARSPLHIKYSHQEYLNHSELDLHSSPFMQRNMDLWRSKVAFHNPSQKHVFGLFLLSGKMLRLLKLKAKNEGVAGCTSFMAALAHLWRARTASLPNIKPGDISTVQFAVDIRSKMRPPLPREFAGNATVTAYAKATAKELQEQPFSQIVKKLEEGADRMNDDYVRSRIDWLELHDGVICLEKGFLVTSWSHMGFGDVEFGGGIKSVYSGPIVTGRVDVVIFMADPKDEDGIKIYIGLEPSHMAKFQLLIQNVDADATIRSNL